MLCTARKIMKVLRWEGNTQKKMRQKRRKGGERRSSDVQRGGRLVNDGGDSGKGLKKRAMNSRVGRTEKDKKRRRKEKRDK